MRSTIAALKARVDPIGSSPYFRTLRDGSMTKDEFVETQIQFFHAVIFFSRPMAALVGRIPRPQMRVALLENIGDEHGSGRLTVCHENTFVELLSRLGVERLDIDRRAMWPEVRAFNSALLGTCASDDVYTGLAALGIIEDMFSGISTEIGQSIVARGWLKRREVVHYTTHAELDVQHAEGFYASLHEPYERHPRWRYQIDQGLELGAYAFLRLYDDLWRARERRWMREVLGPHSLSDGAWLEGTEAIQDRRRESTAESREAVHAGIAAASAPSTAPATTAPTARAVPMSK
jgi:pyrroloquinoline quinone (PQQ) biosynthesis protein C